MVVKTLLVNNKMRHLLRIIVACLVAASLSYYLHYTQLNLMLITTVFVMLTATGSALYQGIIRYFTLLGLVVIIDLLWPSMRNFYSDLNTVTLGATIGLIANILIFPDKISIEFQRAVLPLLQSSVRYFSAITTLLLTGDPAAADKEKNSMEQHLLMLPTWVDEPGFDITLQKGYRYYVMKLNHLAEILFSMHYLARYRYDQDLLDSVKDSLLQSVRRMHEFIDGIITLLNLKKLQEGVHDFAEDIDEMERQFKAKMTLPIDLLESHQDYRSFAEFIRDLSELRVALIQLAKALRNTK